MPSTLSSRLSLTWHLRQAIEAWLGDYVTDGNPWGDLIEVWAEVIDKGELDLGTAARLDLLLRSTVGHELPQCPACQCPMPGMSHVCQGDAVVSRG